MIELFMRQLHLHAYFGGAAVMAPILVGDLADGLPLLPTPNFATCSAASDVPDKAFWAVTGQWARI